MIYYKKHFLTISFLILLINNCYCNSIFREDKINRNLGLEKRNNDLTPWCGCPYQNIILFDSINHIEGKYSIAIRPFPVFSGNKVRIAQRFYIKEAKKIYFSVFHKSNSSWNTTLSLEGYNKLGISIFRKENKIDVENEWKSSNISIQTPPLVEYITISINSTFLNQSSPFTSRLWIDKAIVIIDDKIVTNYEYPTIKEDVFNNEELANKKFINPQNIGELDLYKNKKILGIGESIHGSASIEKFYLNYFKYLVINKKTKVLLFELPYEMVLTWNQFINEQTEIPLDQLIEKELLVDREALKDFLFWLRDYQKTNNSKILLIGIDIKYSDKETSYLIKYLESFKKHKIIREMLNLYSKNNSSESFKEINKFCSKNRLELIHSIGKDNGLMLLRAIENQISEKVPPLGIERELAMANNIFFAIDSLSNKEERLAIWAHTIHLRKTYFGAFDMSPSVGNFIQNKYGDNYQAITVLVGQGERVSYNSKIEQETFRLKQAPENSLEYCCSKLFNKHSDKNEYLYIPFSDKNKSDYVLMRHGGLGEIYYSFYELPFRRSYDGLVYINESEPIQIITEKK